MPETADFERLAERVRSRRHELGLTQSALATEARATDRLIRSIELGEERNRHPGTLRSISIALRWTPDSIGHVLAGGDPVEQHEPVEDDNLAQQVAELRDRLARVEAQLASERPEGGNGGPDNRRSA